MKNQSGCETNDTAIVNLNEMFLSNNESHSNSSSKKDQAADILLNFHKNSTNHTHPSPNDKKEYSQVSESMIKK